jgi:hypothetical protein
LWWSAVVALVAVVCRVAALGFHGIIWPNRIFAAGYAVKGIDAFAGTREELESMTLRLPGH